MPKCRMLIQASTFETKVEAFEEDSRESRYLGTDLNIRLVTFC
jgi:hypothetical protein